MLQVSKEESGAITLTISSSSLEGFGEKNTSPDETAAAAALSCEVRKNCSMTLFCCMLMSLSFLVKDESMRFVVS